MVLVLPSSLPGLLLSSLLSFPRAWGLRVWILLWAWGRVSGWRECYCDLGHDDDEIGLLDGQFFDRVLVGHCLALEDDLERVGGQSLGFLDFGLEVLDLRGWAVTLSVGSTSTWNTSPLRFLTDSFI